MTDVLCFVWAFLLGAALLCPLAWWLCRRNRPVERDRDRPTPDPLVILWLTPACQTALGRCAQPIRLRAMTAKCIAVRLAGASFPPGESPPPRERFGTWPEQARLLCAGELEQLRVWQQELVRELGGPSPAVVAPAPSDAGEAERPRYPLRWLALMLLLLLGSLLAFVAARQLDQCWCPPQPLDDGPPVRPVPVTPTPTPCPTPTPAGTPTGTTLSMSTDLLFDFNRREPYSDLHLGKMQAALAELFGQFEGIEIKSIQAHTDPIGGTTENKALGDARARFIRDLVERVRLDPQHAGRFKGTPLPDPVPSDGPSHGDSTIWEECFERYYRANPDKPLVDLRRQSNQDGRPLCSQATAVTGPDVAFPACARLPTLPPRGMSTAAYARSAENFRELAACLAPMRHVLIRIEYSGRVAPTATATAEKVQEVSP
jgi:hypothetical protein